MFFVASLLAACGPGEPSDTDTEGEPTSTSTGPTTGEPPPTTSSGEETTGEPPLVGVECEQLAGPEGSAVEWYLRCGGNQHDYVFGIATDAAGDLYVAVELRAFDGAQTLKIGEFEVKPGEHSDILLIKLSSAGVPQWVRHFGGPKSQQISGLVACGDGFVIHGWADVGSLDFGGGPVEGTYVASFDFDGNHRWSRSLPVVDDATQVYFLAMTCDDAGQLALTGEFLGGVDLGGGPVSAAADGFVVTYDAAGEFQWAQQFGSAAESSARGRALAFTPGGELVMTGSFTGTVDLGGGPLTAVAFSDMLVAEYSAAGEHLWSRQFGGAGGQDGTAVAVDATGRVVVGGAFFDEIEIGDEKFVNENPEDPEELTSADDAVLVELDASGALLGSQHLATPLNDRVLDLSFGAADSLRFAGVADSAFSLRAFAGEEQTWEWSAKPLNAFPRAAWSGEEAVFVSAAPHGDVDLGSGALGPRGAADMLIARIRR
ncbi:hypothetical protein [Nannocystis pusilla]|uniref:hypothetical protein n=1 Tax=Nannocystis pusilla TaxID=889268 RepID=UPI003DA4AC82